MPAAGTELSDPLMCTVCEKMLTPTSPEEANRAACICGSGDCSDEDEGACDGCMARDKICGEVDFALEHVEPNSDTYWVRRSEHLLSEILGKLGMERAAYLQLERRAHGALQGEALWELRYTVLKNLREGRPK